MWGLLKGENHLHRVLGQAGKSHRPSPELHKTQNGFSLAQFSQKDFFIGNATIYNHLIIFTSRSAYDKFAPLPPTIRFVLPLKISAAPFSPLRRHQKTLAAYSLCYLRWL